MQKKWIALLTDFGLKDHYVASLKVAILKVNSSVNLIDLCHDVPAQDVEHAGFMLCRSYKDFPLGTIFVAVVDPGVGSKRKAILVQKDGYSFIGPDNGLFSWFLEGAQIFELNNSKYFGDLKSQTFHGRDIFAPCAGHLSQGIAAEDLGIEMRSSLKTFQNIWPSKGDLSIEGRFVIEDHYGNLITNIHKDDLCHFRTDLLERLRFYIDDDIQPLVLHYEEGREYEVVFLWGSSGYLELCSYCKRASEIKRDWKGIEIRITCHANDK